MRFGGIQRHSLIDYPGKVSCVIFLSGCNFECPYCHNPSLLNGDAECPAFFRDNGLFDFLEKRRDFLDGVVISGGEPTLQSDLMPLCKEIKGMGYSIKLDTNGSRPEELKRLLEHRLVDYVAMDIKTEPISYDTWVKKHFNPEDLLSSIRTILESAPDYEFRTTCVRPLVDERIIENIARLIEGAKLYALQRFQETEVLNPEFFQKSSEEANEGDLGRLRSIAEGWVEECIIR